MLRFLKFTSNKKKIDKLKILPLITISADALLEKDEIDGRNFLRAIPSETKKKIRLFSFFNANMKKK